MNSLYTKIAKEWNENFMGYSALSIIVSTCLGGITIMSISQHGNSLFQMIQILIVVILCNLVLTSILTLQKPKVVFKSIVISLFICSLIAILNFIFQ